MKILKRGNADEFTRNITCGYCYSELEYTRPDIRRDRDGVYIVCPVCLNIINI